MWVILPKYKDSLGWLYLFDWTHTDHQSLSHSGYHNTQRHFPLPQLSSVLSVKGVTLIAFLSSGMLKKRENKNRSRHKKPSLLSSTWNGRQKGLLYPERTHWLWFNDTNLLLQRTKPICSVSLFDSGWHACWTYSECLAYVCRALNYIQINFLYIFFRGRLLVFL